jgi:hypothetical protein
MNSGDEVTGTSRQFFDRDEVDGVLSGAFYNGGASGPAEAGADDKKRPAHYKVICISMYTDALSRLDAMVRELKARGYTKANRSALIRHALETVNLDSIPRGL